MHGISYCSDNKAGTIEISIAWETTNQDFFHEFNEAVMMTRINKDEKHI